MGYCFAGFGFTRGRNPAAMSFAWPALPRTLAMKAWPSALLALELTTHMPYCTFGCAHAGTLITVTRPGTVFASVEYTNPASASPSATFERTSRTSVSWLTTFFVTEAERFMFFRICRV